jgi:hypothetical protein
MLSREDTVFTIGYDGPSAVVDKEAKKRYGALSTVELAERGLFRAAYSSALWSKDPSELEAMIQIYNKITGASLSPVSSLDRLFGVFPVKVKRSIVL